MILVTGASGFLGRHLVKALADKGLQVRALFHKHPPTGTLAQLPNVEWVSCDLLDIFDVARVLQGVQEVYHCAAIVSFDQKDKHSILDVNLQTTANLVNQLLGHPLRKLLMVSSIATLGRSELSVPLKETDFWEESKENSLYARSKYLAEMEVWRAMAEGLPAVVINPAIILGASHNWDTGSARLMKVCDENFPFYTDGVNGWVGVQDVVQAMILLMESEVVEERFIISAGNYGYRDIFSKMALALGKRPPAIKAPYWATQLIWRWNALRLLMGAKSVSITKETARTARAQCYYQNDKFLKQFPNFQYTPMDKVIAEMATAYQSRNN